MYKIFIDKTKLFECDIDIEGASLDQSEVRLCLEADNFNIMFKGKITKDGDVKIPISKLKGILQEDFVGKISLEVIAEDTVFVPWESEFKTTVSKKVKVSVDESLTESSFIDQKPKMKFNLKETFDSSEHINNIFDILKENKVSVKEIYRNKEILNELVKTYCGENKISEHYNTLQKEIIETIRAIQ